MKIGDKTVRTLTNPKGDPRGKGIDPKAIQEMMRKEMPVAYWKLLPEAARIPALVADANRRACRPG